MPDNCATTLAASISRNAARIAVEVPSLDAEITYGELRARAVGWAQAIPSHDRIWVLYLEKGLALYQLLAACFLHRISFCPLDAALPIARVQTVASQFANPIIITDSEACKTGCALDFEVMHLPSLDPPASRPPEGASIATSSESPHYFIATSGSTGTPRLVQVRHDATRPFIDWAVPFYRVDTRDAVGAFSSPGFDLSLVDFLTVLHGGGTLISVRTLRERLRPDHFVSEHEVTHWHSVPTMIPYLVEGADVSSVQCFTFCGEPLLRTHCESLRTAAPGARIINTYGPTEGTLFCSRYEVQDRDIAGGTFRSMPIGGPIPGWSFLFLRDGDWQRLVLLGENLATRYLGTSEGGFDAVDVLGTRLACFDTGDYFEFRAGEVCFGHRRDQMIKIQGNRIDLGEIADACARVGVRQPVVLPHRAAVVLFAEWAPDDREVVSRLQELLPAYAIPRRILRVDGMPRTSNGKIDRAALQQLLVPHS